MTDIFCVIVHFDAFTLTGQQEEGSVQHNFLLSEIFVEGMIQLHQGPVSLDSHVPAELYLLDVTEGDRLPAGP